MRSQNQSDYFCQWEGGELTGASKASINVLLVKLDGRMEICLPYSISLSYSCVRCTLTTYEILSYKCLRYEESCGFFTRLNLDALLVSSAWTHPQIWFLSLSKCMHTDGSSKDACPTTATCHLKSLFGRCLDKWLHHIGLWRILTSLSLFLLCCTIHKAWRFWCPYFRRDGSKVLYIICQVIISLLSVALEMVSFRFQFMGEKGWSIPNKTGITRFSDLIHFARG